MIAIPPWRQLRGVVRQVRDRVGSNSGLGSGEYISRTDQNATAFRQTFSDLGIDISDPWAAWIAVSSACVLRGMVVERIRADNVSRAEAELMLSHVEVFISTCSEFFPMEAK